MVKVAQIARMVAKPGKREELIAALEPAFEKAEREQGTELYLMVTNARTLHKRITGGGKAEVEVTDHPDEVWFFELYDNAAAVRAHEEGYALSEAALSIGPKLKELLAEPHTIVQGDLALAKGAEATP